MRTTYAITDRRLTIEIGLVSKELHQTRLERVQNVNSSQSVLERALHIGTVDFDTAAEAEYDFSFHGIASPRGIVRTVDRALHELRGVPGARAARRRRLRSRPGAPTVRHGCDGACPNCNSPPLPGGRASSEWSHR